MHGKRWPAKNIRSRPSLSATRTNIADNSGRLRGLFCGVIAETGSRLHGFGFHLLLGLLIKRNREIWLGGAASALYGNARQAGKLSG
jgi:hypothetical protein